MSEQIYGTDGHGGHWLTGEEIVRCRDCVWFAQGDDYYAADDWCRCFNCETEPCGFCSWGRRKEDGDGR